LTGPGTPVPGSRRHALVAVSGGLDSAMALHLACRSYDRVRAVWVRTTTANVPPEVRAVTGHLGVPLEVLDSSRDFERQVVAWSGEMLSRGLTPNPCARCNALVKMPGPFGMLDDREDLLTGHYARMGNDGLHRGVDGEKDQSYFLSMVRRQVLDRCVFPLGGMSKTEVRRRAEKLGLPFRRMESMDLCFQTAAKGAPGDVVDLRGNRLGTHSGVERFTIGQRKGLGALGRRMYVVALDPVRRTVTVGGREDLMVRGCTLELMNWLEGPFSGSFSVLAQTRYRRRPVPAVVETFGAGDGGMLTIEFRGGEEAVAPGQVCALYLASRVIGGGTIVSTRKE